MQKTFSGLVSCHEGLIILIEAMSGVRRFSTHKTGASPRIFLIGGKRTPFAKFGESLKDITPVDLAVISAKATLKNSNNLLVSKIGNRVTLVAQDLPFAQIM